MTGWVEGICRALVLGLVLIAGTAIEQAPSVGPRVEPITTVIRRGRLGWYVHVMRKSDDDWVKKCMEYRVEARRPIERPTSTWL